MRSVAHDKSPKVPSAIRGMTRIILRSTVLIALVLAAAPAAMAQDVVTVGSVTANSTQVDVPVYIRDVSGTSLGMDMPAGSRIQSFSIKVTYAPASAVSDVTFSRAGVTANLTPTVEFAPETPDSISLLATFSEAGNQIPFTLNASAPGNLVAHLVFDLSLSAVPGSAITLTLDPSTTQITNQGGTTKETTANGGLSLVDGSIQIAPLSLSLSPSTHNITVGSSTSLTATMNFAVSSDTTVTVVSTDGAVAAVPPSVVIPAGSRTTTIPVTAGATGSATVTASLPPGAGGASASSTVIVSDPPPECVRPAAPQISGPASVLAGATFDITWPAVSAATEYILDEASTPGFTNAVSRTFAASPATFTAGTAGSVRYYRARAANKSPGCNVSSESSTTLAVTATQVVVPDRRVFAVAGSTAGNFGSFFRTSLQLHNPTAATISGKIIFHPAGVPASPADPALGYVLAPKKSITYDDLLPAMGLTTGVGSVDVIADAGSHFPATSMRVFNDGGAAGTSGLSQEAVRLTDALLAGATGILIAPADIARARLNIGVRTLDAGATITVQVHDRDGIERGTLTKTYPGNYFAQVSSGEFLGFALAGGDAIALTIDAGSAIIYGSTTDNITNDPSQQFARPIDP